MGERWIKEAEDLKTGSSPGTMEGGAPKVTWHVTVCPSGGGYFDAMHKVLVDKASEPHLLYDPVTDRLGQYFALDTSARALRNDGTRRTNGSGSVNIQIEVVAMADDFTRYWKPGPNFRALMRAIRSWGVPDVWPGGNPYGQPPRSWTTYVKAGHFGHVHVPGNDHTDPQVKDGSLLFKASEEDVPLTKDDAYTVLATGILDNPFGATPTPVSAGYVLENLAAKVLDLGKKVDALAAKAQPTAPTLTDADIAAIATKVTELLASRLQN